MIVVARHATNPIARNSDLWPFLDSMKQMEDRFNHWAGYDYVFLNEEVGCHFKWTGYGVADLCRSSQRSSRSASSFRNEVQ